MRERVLKNVVTDEDVDISILENDNKYKDYKVNHINYEIDEMFKKVFQVE